MRGVGLPGRARPPRPAPAGPPAPPRRARARCTCEAASPPQASASDTSRTSPRRRALTRAPRRRVGGQLERRHHVVALHAHLEAARRARARRASAIASPRPRPGSGRARRAAPVAQLEPDPRGNDARAQLGTSAAVLGRVGDQVAERLGEPAAVGADSSSAGAGTASRRRRRSATARATRPRSATGPRRPGPCRDSPAAARRAEVGEPGASRRAGPPPVHRARPGPAPGSQPARARCRPAQLVLAHDPLEPPRRRWIAAEPARSARAVPSLIARRPATDYLGQT